MNRTYVLIGVVIVAVVALGVAAWLVFSGGSSDTTTAAGPMAIILKSDDRTMGNKNAPLTVVEYAAPTCPHCAHFDMDIFPQFKKDYIDTGRVFFVFRVFPLNAADVAAEAIARCLPEDNYFQFLDLLYRNQPKWDPEYQVADVRAGLVEMAKIEGFSAQQVDQCISNQAMQKRIQDVGADAQTRYGINGTPSFVAGGQVHGPFGDYQEFKTFLDGLLAKKK
ncbi:MAG TPA: thioredoxin domain-containing protein [Rhizomicrobium sp.]|nr:thioredoxin domain-containing protein [Rhizomicrobium sp.]